jgi:hypothetical protein
MRGMESSSLVLTAAFFITLTMPVYAAASGVITLPQTGQTTSHVAGDDGALRKGAPWPVPRFTNLNGTTPITDSVVLDRLTGLVWTKDATVPGPSGSCASASPKLWQEALDYVACLNGIGYLGYSDWRLPNRKELRSLVNYGSADNTSWLQEQGFTDVDTSRYWTSTTYAYPDLTGLAWEIVMRYGQTSEYDSYKDGFLENAWPVRGGHEVYAAPADLPRTGQATVYSAGDDGALRKGAPWPSSRFTNQYNGTIKDNLTGLIWTADGNAPGPLVCNPGVSMAWNDAFGYVSCLNSNGYLGYADWRLPNVNELESLVHAGSAPIVYWLNSQGFANLPEPPSYYWSSTSYACSADLAWYVDLYVGVVRPLDKGNTYSVWPVREHCSTTEVTIEGTSSYYSTIQGAYNAAKEGQTLQMQAATFSEIPDLANNISVRLQGGYECGYLSRAGFTTINGYLIISDGAVTIENLVIQ